MDRATKIAQEAVHWVIEQSRLSNPPSPVGPMDYEAAFAEKLRKHFPEALPVKCERCRRKREDVAPRDLLPGTTRALCGECKARWDETFPLIMSEFMKGALYPKQGKLFLAGRGTYGGILRGGAKS